MGITALGTDADLGTTVSYSLTDSAGGRFAINASTGVITVADGTLLDAETATSHSVTVLASSSDGSTQSASYAIAVSNVADNPVVLTDNNAAPNTVAENAANGTVVAPVAPTLTVTSAAAQVASVAIADAGTGPTTSSVLGTRVLVDPGLQNQPVDLLGGDVRAGLIPAAAGTVPASSQVIPSSVLGAVDLNALPAPGATLTIDRTVVSLLPEEMSAALDSPVASGGRGQGSEAATVVGTSDVGFSVARVVSATANASFESSTAVDNHRLFVFEGVKEAIGVGAYQLPVEAFAHTDPGALVKLEARTTNGDPLPAWIYFDAVTGTFRGTPPSGQTAAIEVVVFARDNAFREASVVFTLELGTPSPVASLMTPPPFDSMSIDRGFPVMRVADGNAGAELAGTELGQAGQRLFVFQGVQDARGTDSFQIGQEAFAHTDSSAVVRLEAVTASGEALPAWLKFDAVSGTFRGTPPAGDNAVVDVVVIARDTEAREARANFTLQLGVTAGSGDPAQTLSKSASAMQSADAAKISASLLRSGGELISANGAAAALPTDQSSEFDAKVQASQPQSGSGATEKAFLDPEAAKAISAASFIRLDVEVTGYPVARIGEADTTRTALSEDQTKGGEKLFIYRGIKEARGATEFVIPRDAFAHTDSSAVVRLEAQLADGSSLPSWLSFDGLTGSFRGIAPDGRSIVDILITAYDNEGREASIIFQLDLGATDDGAGAKGATSIEDGTATGSVDSLDLPSRRVAADEETADSVDDAGGKSANLRGDKQSVKRSALPFAEQIKAAKATRDPILAKILGNSAKPTKRTSA